MPAADAVVVAVGVLGGPGGVDGVRADVLAAGGPDGADFGAGVRDADGARLPGGVPGPAKPLLRAGDLPPPRHHRPLRLPLLPRHQAPQLPAQVEKGRRARGSGLWLLAGECGGLLLADKKCM